MQVINTGFYLYFSALEESINYSITLLNNNLLRKTDVFTKATMINMSYVS